MAEKLSFYSDELRDAQSVDAVVRAPISDEGIFMVGLSKEMAKAAPKAELYIAGTPDSVAISRPDGSPLEIEWIDVDEEANITSRLKVIKAGIVEAVFEHVGKRKTPGKVYKHKWLTDAAVDAPLAESLALGISKSCKKLN